MCDHKGSLIGVGSVLVSDISKIIPPIIEFDEALQRTGKKNRSLLIGNGFSRACRDDLFSYTALFEASKDELDPKTKSAFEALGTTDFETVMKALKQGELLVKNYSPGDLNLSQKFRDEASSLRDILAKVIASNHPERMDEISEEKFSYCRQFISNFARIYSLNYDLLLYWALMQDDLDEIKIKCDDGFRFPGGEPTDHVAWDFSEQSQNVFYMHGALHIFDAGSEIQKYTWSNTGVALVDQIREALEQDRFPIYVAEGSSDSKVNRILHNSFLIRGYRSLSEIGGSLFVFGHSLNDNDEHILKCIERNKATDVYVSIFGDPFSSDNQRIIARADSLILGRTP